MALPDEAPASRSRLRDAIRPALFEATFVVFGVVVALAANEWRETRANRRDAAVALADITTEVRANRDAVRASLGYHSGLIGSLSRRPDSLGPPDASTFSRGFISPAQLSASAWGVAGETGVTRHISYPVVLRLSRAYALQSRYEEQARSFGQVLYGELYRSGPQAIAANYRHLTNIIGAFSYRERQLLAIYDSTLAQVAGDSMPAGVQAALPAGAPAHPSARQ
jgi:hypothetical protein